MKQAPWAVDDNMSYGYVANNKVGCGKCVEFTFNNTAVSGKKMTVMVSNFGNLGGDAHFDIMIPGGGVGDFDALTRQISQNGGSSSDMGARYGGFRAKCGANANCIKKMCDAAFGTSALADLKAGCYWYIDWFKMADNPNVSYKEVTCPQALVDRYKGNFSSNPTPPVNPTTYTLTMNRNPTNGGTTTPASSQSNVNSGSQVSISATAASGYTFSGWTVSGSGTLANANNASTTVTVNGNITVTANFSGGGGNPPTPVRGDTIKVEAENYASKVGNGMLIEGGAIGYIQNGYSATYNVNAGKAGTATMQFRVAAGTDITNFSFSVEVNGQSVGTISQGNTGGWSTFTIVQLGNAVNLRAGSNTIKLNFGSAVNVDYFLLIGDIKSASSVRRAAADASGRSRVTLKPVSGGFNALLPANHGYTSYKLIDVLGREIQSGKIGAGANELSVGGLNHSVFFLKLEGAGKKPAPLRVVSY